MPYFALRIRMADKRCWSARTDCYFDYQLSISPAGEVCTLLITDVLDPIKVEDSKHFSQMEKLLAN